jgi:hypothetical protein
MLDLGFFAGEEELMPGIPAKYRETFSRLKRATDQLHALIESGEFHSYSYLRRRKLITRVRRLYNKLAGPISPTVIGGALAAAGVLALAGCGPEGIEPQVPDFVRIDATTIGLGGYDTAAVSGYLVLADTDSDGDLDLYYAEDYDEGAITRQQNNGSGGFGTKERDPDGLVGVQSLGMDRWEVKPLTFVDIDNDGDLDLLGVGDIYGYPYLPWTFGIFQLVENDGTPTTPAFLPPVQFAPDAGLPYDADAAAFVDIDGDGDLDLVTAKDGYEPFDGGGSLIYLTPNISQSASSFTAADDSTVVFPYSTYYFLDRGIQGLAISDLDQDGDQDITISFYVEAMHSGEAGNRIIHIENQSTEEEIQFATSGENPFNISFPVHYSTMNDSEQMSSLAAGDIDRDGDIDLIVGVYSDYQYPYADLTEFFYLENQAAD